MNIQDRFKVMLVNFSETLRKSKDAVLVFLVACLVVFGVWVTIDELSLQG